MGTCRKIFKPKNLVSLKELRSDLIQVLGLFCEDKKEATIYIENAKTAKQVISNSGLKLNLVKTVYTYNSCLELLEILPEDKSSVLSFWMCNEGYYTKSDSIRFNLSCSLRNDKIGLAIYIPYRDKVESIKQTISLIKHLNTPLKFQFKNDYELEKTITNFLDLHMDNHYHDDEWTLKHINYTFKALSRNKEIFEGNTVSTFRLIGFSISLSEMYIAMYGALKCSKYMLKSLLEFFNNSNIRVVVT